MPPGKRRQLVLTPRVVVEPIMSDASTLIWENSGDVPQETVGGHSQDNSLLLDSFTGIELPGEVVSEDDSLSSLSGDDGFDEEAPMRDDMPITTHRWDKPEVAALMMAVNVNRDAIKFHFQGPGGGKEVKRQGWRDVVGMCIKNMLYVYYML